MTPQERDADTILFKLVGPNEFLCFKIVLSFCWKLFHSTGVVGALLRSNYRVRNSKSGGGAPDWLVLADIEFRFGHGRSSAEEAHSNINTELQFFLIPIGTTIKSKILNYNIWLVSSKIMKQ